MIGYDSVFGFMMIMVVSMAPLLLLLRSPGQAVSHPIEAVD